MVNKDLTRKSNISQPVYVKINALKELRNGANVYDVAKSLNVHVKTVKNWKKQEKRIFEYESSTEELVKKKIKRITKPKNDDIDNAVWNWFQEKRKVGIPLNGMQIRSQALSIYKKLGGEENKFTASAGWLEKFKNRHNIRAIAISDERKSGDRVSEKFAPFSTDENKKELSPHETSNCDETEFNFKIRPKTTLASMNELCTSGYKSKKERILLTYTNAAGNLKLPRAAIRKSVKPRCIKPLIMSKKCDDSDRKISIEEAKNSVRNLLNYCKQNSLLFPKEQVLCLQNIQKTIG